MIAVAWSEVAEQLQPFVARRVGAGDVDDVLQDILLRMHRGLRDLRDEERFAGWMYRIARTAIAEHGRVRGRHPVAEPRETGAVADATDDATANATDDAIDDDRAAARSLAACLTVFVARLASPYREAIALDGLTARDAAERSGVSLPAMKSRVQRGRARLRELLDACCEIAVDARGKVTEFTPRAPEPARPCCGQYVTVRPSATLVPSRDVSGAKSE